MFTEVNKLNEQYFRFIISEVHPAKGVASYWPLEIMQLIIFCFCVFPLLLALLPVFSLCSLYIYSLVYLSLTLFCACFLRAISLA